VDNIGSYCGKNIEWLRVYVKADKIMSIAHHKYTNSCCQNRHMNTSLRFYFLLDIRNFKDVLPSHSLLLKN